MKKLFTIIALVASISAYADDYSLYYDTTSGTKNIQVSIVSMLQKIVFEQNGDMVAYQKDGTKRTVNTSGVSRIFFSTPQAVNIEKTEDAAPIINKGVYDLCGRKLNVDMEKEKLPRGIYIVNGKKVQIK